MTQTQQLPDKQTSAAKNTNSWSLNTRLAETHSQSVTRCIYTDVTTHTHTHTQSVCPANASTYSSYTHSCKLSRLRERAKEKEVKRMSQIIFQNLRHQLQKDVTISGLKEWQILN